MVKKPVNAPENLYRKINEYRKMFDNMSRFTQAVIKLRKA